MERSKRPRPGPRARSVRPAAARLAAYSAPKASLRARLRQPLPGRLLRSTPLRSVPLRARLRRRGRRARSVQTTDRAGPPKAGAVRAKFLETYGRARCSRPCRNDWRRLLAVRGPRHRRPLPRRDIGARPQPGLFRGVLLLLGRHDLLDLRLDRLLPLDLLLPIRELLLPRGLLLLLLPGRLGPLLLGREHGLLLHREEPLLRRLLGGEHQLPLEGRRLRCLTARLAGRLAGLRRARLLPAAHAATATLPAAALLAHPAHAAAAAHAAAPALGQDRLGRQGRGHNAAATADPATHFIELMTSPVGGMGDLTGPNGPLDGDSCEDPGERLFATDRNP